MIKKLLLSIALISIYANMYSQVHWDTVYVRPLEICLGQCVDLYSNGSQDQTLMYNDFNDNSIGSGWATNVSPIFSNPCGNTLDGTPCCWFGENAYPRSLETVNFVVSTECEICFDLKLSQGEGGSNCESPDESDEGVVLQWSNDNGATWNDIIYFCPDGNLYSSYADGATNGSDISNGTHTNFTDWHNYCFQVPAAAAGPNTRFRWYQDLTSGSSYDNWGIDNVYIHCPQPPATIVWNDSNNGDFYYDADPPDQCPTQNTTYTATISDGTSSDVASFDVIVYQPPTMEIQGLASQYCIQEQAVTLNGVPSGGEFSGQGMNGNVFDPATAGVGGPYTITYTWYQLSTTGDTLCSYSTDTTVTVVDGATPDFTVETPICESESSTVQYTGNANSSATFTWNWDGASASPGTGAGPHTISNTAPGTYDIYLQVSQNGCSYDTTIQLTIYEEPVADAGEDDEICGNTYQLNATASIGAGTWSQVSGPGTTTFSDATASNSTVTVTDYGTYVYKWKEVSNICSDSDYVSITFYEIPVADAGDDMVICGPASALNATPSVGVGTWTVQESGISIDNIHNANSGINAPDYGVYHFTWTEVNHICVDSDHVQYTFYEIPTSNFSAEMIHCFNDQSTVTYLGNAPSSANYIWNWDGANVNPGTGQGPHIVSWNTAGTYNISLVVENNGCYSETTTVSLINPELLTATASATDIMCFGDSSGTVTAEYQGGTYPFTIQWNTPNNDNSLTVTHLSGGSYTVEITDGLGCHTSATATVHEPPKLILAPIQDYFVCYQSTVNATANVTGGTPSYTYYWDNVASSSNSFTEQALSDTTHCLKVVDQNNCADSLCFNIEVTPPVHLQLYANADSVCPGDPVLVTASISGGAGAPYMVTDYNTGDVVSPPMMVYPTEDGTITLRVEDVCGAYDTSSVKLNLYPLPPVNFDSDIQDGCQPLIVSFNESNAYNGQSYFWDFGDNSVENYSGAKNPVHIFRTSGSFDVTLTVTSIHGCKNTLTKENFITVYPKPHAKFYFDPKVGTTVNPTITFTNVSTGMTSCLWAFGDGDSSLMINPVHTYPSYSAKDYLASLIVTSEFGCKDTARTEVPIKPVPTLYAPTAFSPDKDHTNEKFFVVGSNIDPDKFSLKIYDRWGEVIWETTKFDPETGKSEGWNGIAKGNKIVQNGVYKWLVIYYDTYGSMGEASGNVTVIR